MADADDLLQLAYRANDAAETARIAQREQVDQQRYALLKDFADAKRIVTALRALETASGGTLEVRTETNANAGSVAFIIREPEQHKLALSQMDNKLHGYRLVVEPSGAYLETYDRSALFVVSSPLSDMFNEDEISSRLNGVEPALKTLFQWAGANGYIKRPKVYPVSFGRDKQAPSQ